MSRWGDFSWGDGTLYGASDGSTALAWGVEIDWDNDGAFDGSNEASQMLAFSCFRGRRSWLDLGAGGFAAVESGSAQITLDNSDGLYDAWNTSSPLYPNVRDGRDVRIRIIDLSTGVIYPVFFGVITNIQASNFADKPTVVLKVEDGWRNLRRTAARVTIQNNISVNAAIGLVLDAAKWPSRWGRSLDVSSDSIEYFWGSGSVEAATELRRLAEAALGYFFISAQGVAKFVARTNVIAAVCDLVQEQLTKSLSLAQPWENRRSITRVRAHPRAVAASVNLWQQAGSAPAIVSGTPLVIWASYLYNNNPTPGKNVITPVATTDWTTNTAADGTGTDKTGVTSVSFYDFGDSAKLTFTYSGGGTIYLTSAKIRGDAVYEPTGAEVTYPTDPSTVTDPREFVLDLPWQQNVNIAADFANVIGPFLAGEHPFPTVEIDSRPDLQFIPDLFDVVTATLGRLGINGVSFRAAGIGHQASGAACQQVLTTLYLEPYIASSTAWTWPVTNFGVDTIFGW